MNRLRAERQRLGLSQAQVATMSKVHYSSVSLWESGRRRPREHAASRLVAIFDLPLDDLLHNDDEAPSNAEDLVDSTLETAKKPEPCNER